MKGPDMCLMYAAPTFFASNENTGLQKDICFDYQVWKVKFGKNSIFTVNTEDGEIAGFAMGS